MNISGGSSLVAMTFKKDKDYTFISHIPASDGAYYESSLKELFPKRYWSIVLSDFTDSVIASMWPDHVNQARKYLISIGRDETICRYGEFTVEFLTDYGVDEEVVNKISDLNLEYDTTIGNHEVLCDGKRYVYQTGYDVENNLITFLKYEAGTDFVAEFVAVDGDTGKIVKDVPVPDKIEYYHSALITDSETAYTTVAYYQ